MNGYPAPSELAQLPLIQLEGGNLSSMMVRKKKRVEETFARIRQLHDELNAQLYSYPSERPVIHSPADVSNGDKSTQNAGLKSPLFAN